ncbi:MAG: L-seryl-tRNA(Sec) selenium transferase [Candidatus Tectomicrobia bacterium]|nr:L-seryl-tRNA(Sec) selenium transferase [Candidatus Tectomicrobia bacterium]
MSAWKSEHLRRLPAVDEILRHPLVAEQAGGLPHRLLVAAVREAIEAARQRILQAVSPDQAGERESAALAGEVVARLRQVRHPQLRRVINATGVILHTNLGRSVLAEEAMQAIQRTAASYTNLEYDLQAGERGERYEHLRALLRRLAGAEDALVVNNNAAAVLLSLQALAQGREVIVSRGELVEIGGSFRIPEIMALSGALLREVGTTNKTRLADYEGAIGPHTALLLKVHPSNFRVVGFAEEVPPAELAALGRRRNLPVMVDLGSGSFLSGLPGDEPTVPDVVAAGADLVCFSGDKLLGGPQAGIIVGARDLLRRLQRHPLTRAVRVDKLTLAALEATLRLYLDEARARRHVPTLRLLTLTPEELAVLAKELAKRLREVLDSRFTIELAETTSAPGGGSLPTLELPTTAVALRCDSLGSAAIERHLRGGEPPVIARVRHDVVLLDVRTLLPDDLSDLVRSAARLATLPPEQPPTD